jgi:hypothetical protein
MPNIEYNHKMKKNLFISTCIIYLITSYSFSQQVSFTCISCEICEFNETKKIFDNCQEFSESSSFTVNESETVISHVSLKSKNVFYVNEKTIDEEKGMIIYNTYDEGGNWYMLKIDLLKNEIIVMDLSKPPVDKPYKIYHVRQYFEKQRVKKQL